ncbi:hypothetical protein BP00DRAFT_430793 [Aspergillus indologenus CBS 114.80]|uniref:Uncharacterized protein n=1 Tax=Aspergillus indologenus CBS 114.80 TaxID=1450541 RepID=A0A2V5HQ97_9EURO|nr:hypothetical protein BP00DRAFT_430793 [Aspergillus indologenus CBS 114.80]
MSSSRSFRPSDDRGPQIRAISIALIILPSVAVALRFWSRALLPKPPRANTHSGFWWDDWTALAAAVSRGSPLSIGMD